MSFEKDFEQNMKQLMQILKKLMLYYPSLEKNPKWQKALNDKDTDLNVFMFNFFPLPTEELDEIEDMFEQAVTREEDFKCELNSADEEFLKKHGIQF